MLGLDDKGFLAGLEKALKRVDKQARGSLRELGQIIAEDTRARAPVGETGDLKASIRSTPHPSTKIPGTEAVTISVNVPYAAYVEFGTSDMAPEPYFRPALADAKVKARVVFGKHPI